MHSWADVLILDPLSMKKVFLCDKECCFHGLTLLVLLHYIFIRRYLVNQFLPEVQSQTLAHSAPTLAHVT